MFILYCKTLLLLLRWGTGKVRGRFSGMDRFKGGVIINVIRDIITCRYFYLQYYLLFLHNKCIVPSDYFKCKYIVVKAT